MLYQKKAKHTDLKAKQTDLLSANDSSFYNSAMTIAIKLRCSVLQDIKNVWEQ